MGIGNDRDDGNSHKNDGEHSIKQIAAAGLGLFLRGAGSFRINIAGSSLLLTGFLFSGCTHLLLHSSQVMRLFQKPEYQRIITNAAVFCNEKIVNCVRFRGSSLLGAENCVAGVTSFRLRNACFIDRADTARGSVSPVSQRITWCRRSCRRRHRDRGRCSRAR